MSDYSQDPQYISQLNPDELAEYQQLGTEEQAKADLPELVKGPGTIQNPNSRVMTGAINAAQAAEQTTALSGDTDLTKEVNEKGQPI